jgi:uncharacterized protein (DUF1800 family)
MKIDPQTAWLRFEPTATQPWSKRLASHLYRRAGFGTTQRELDELATGTVEAAIDRLFQVDAEKFDRTMDVMSRTILASGDAKQLSSWWLYRMRFTPHPLLEKMTLFWHGHFATSAAKVTQPKAMLDQNALLRKFALGRFEPFVQAISRDPAMLVYLDSTENRKTHPNENYARELMELFCLGVGNYTEADVQQVARCFTGWEIRRHQFGFNKYQHDFDQKTVLGQRGDFDGDDAIKIVLAQPAAARFIARKLIRFFVTDDSQLGDEWIEPLAAKIRETDWDFQQVMRTLLSSQMFFSEMAIGQKIRPPVDLVIGWLRSLEMTSNLQQAAERLSAMGQLPFYPPNVKGWDGGQSWINSSTLINRNNFVIEVLQSAEAAWDAGDALCWFKQLNAEDAREAVQRISELFLAVDLPDSVIDKIVATLPAPKVNSAQDVKSILSAFGLLPEFQLA